MSQQPHRLAAGGRIDRSRVNIVTFDGRQLLAHPGDTLASAILASEERIVGRSFKYHRPRGVFSAGAEEPNALVTLRHDGRREPNVPATQIEAYDGLIAAAQNGWPNVRFDVGAVNQLLSPVLSAGFYYKTFMGPVLGPLKGTRLWMFCEHFIRRAAGMGIAATKPDPDHYDKVHAYCDVLVVGSGPAGLAAAAAAAEQGAKVIVCEQDFELGGALLATPVGSPLEAWRQELTAKLEAADNVEILTRTTAFGAYDGNVFGLLERCWDHVATPPADQPRQRYWQARATQVIYATGALERPLVFAGNDRPGVMLAGALQQYVNRYAVMPGRDIVLVTNNDSAYAVAVDAADAGARVTLLDVRRNPLQSLAETARAAGVIVRPATAVLRTNGSAAGLRSPIATVRIGDVDSHGRITDQGETLYCSALGVAGGWSPVIHLWSQPGRKPVYDNHRDCFVAGEPQISGGQLVGAATGAALLEDAVAQGWRAGVQAAQLAAPAGRYGQPGAPPPIPDTMMVDWTRDIAKVRAFTNTRQHSPGKAFVDLQHDVTASDIAQAHSEGYVSVEHLKRYTTAGMATDQGKTSNVLALAAMADLRGIGIDDVGTTTFRPPFTPVSIGALANHHCGRLLVPTRRTALHDWHEQNGAVFTEAGPWLRPQYYRQGNEDIDAAYRREAAHVRQHVGIVDVSTLGKIAVQGPDAAEFLNRVYVNGWNTLAIGRLRYAIMLRADGFVFDDGATARLGEHDYLMSTTTTNAGPVMAHLEYLLQTVWPELKVHVTSVTDQWAAIAVAGPKSRNLLQAADARADLSRGALANNHFTYATLAGAKVRVHRMSYSGELAYEVFVRQGHAMTVWTHLLEVGAAHNVIAYGTEAMGTLRIEKGHVAGPELDGRTTLKDLSLENFASSKKPFIGGVLRHREALADTSRPSLVGLEIAGDVGAKAGMLLFPRTGPTTGFGDGHVTSTTYSPALGKFIALGLLSRGPQRQGEIIRCIDFLKDQTVEAKVVSHHFYDPEGARQNG